jgi:ABC-type transporter Mla subunit MlaD
MRRLAVLPLLAIGLLAGCSQVAQFAGETVGVDVTQVCTSVDETYAQYQGLLEQGDATAEQVSTSRDELVSVLERLADDFGGQAGDLISTNAQRLAEVDPNAPEAIEAVEQVKSSLEPFCG